MTRSKQERLSGLVRLRGGFSDTSGIAPRNRIIQLEEFDDDTRTKISNALRSVFEEYFDNPSYFHQTNNGLSTRFCKDFLNDALCLRIELKCGYEYDWRSLFETISDVIQRATYNEVLDVIEYSCRWIAKFTNMGYSFFSSFNRLFEQEYVGYRFVDGRIVAISDETEICAIEEACQNPYEGCRVQLKKALEFLADRENRDYKNSIKESISAVESICQVIVNNEKATLGDALKQLKNRNVALHQCLIQAFQKLYGYASDQGGIRHAEGMFESKVTFEDAKFMLVVCSAFINFLIAEMGKEATHND